MIWAILIFLGIPIWLIAIALILLLRGRRQVRGITGAVECKARVVSGELAGLKPGFARFSSIGLWVHDVLVLYGGNPFLTRVTPCGIATMEHGPVNVDLDTVKKINDPVAVLLRHDAGATLELVCSRASLGALLGPFAARSPSEAPLAKT